MIKENKKISKIEMLFLSYIALMICVYNNCYLKWNSYNHSMISVIIKLMYHTASSFLLIYAITIRHILKKFTTFSFLSILISITLYIHVNMLGAENMFLNMIPMLETMIVIIAIYIMDDRKKNILFERVIILFSILVLPSMIYFILYKLGIHVPYTILQSDNPRKIVNQISYMHYPFGLIVKSPWSIARYTGVFDEPGVIGTMSAFLIAAGYRRCDRKWILLLFVEGMLSFSMAFYALLVIFMIVKAFTDGLMKAAWIMTVIIIVFLIFANYPFKNENLREIQNRIDITSPFLIKDNRTSNTFDIEFDKFIEDGGYDLIMGKGGIGAYELNPNMFGSNSYKCLIYDLGIVGSLLYIGIFGLFVMTRKWNKEYIPFVIVFIASIYQRAYVYNVQMVSIFLLGITYISTTVPCKSRFVFKQKKRIIVNI